MLRQALSGTFGRCAGGNQAGIALPTVLVAILFMTLLAAGVAHQAKSEMQAGRLEGDVAQVHALLSSAVDEASLMAWSNPNFANPYSGFPSHSSAPPAGWQPCSPVAVDSSDPDGPQYCLDFLQRTETISVRFHSTNSNCNSTPYDCAVVPMRVRWRLKAGEPIEETYGWMFVQFTDTTKSVVANVRSYFDHKWCRDGIGLSNVCG